jgi:anti-sigma-K factor RskA
MKPQRRWIKSAIAAAAAPVAAMPWARGQRRKPLAIRLSVPKSAIAAR